MRRGASRFFLRQKGELWMRVKTDWLLFLTILGMVSIGLVFVYSASSVIASERYGEPSYYFFLRQGVAAILSFCILLILAKSDYRNLRSPRWAFTCLGCVVALLIAVYFADPQSHRFIRLGFTQLQPSELAKPALIVFLAWFVTLRSSAINSRHTILPAAITLMVLALLVVAADLGTAVVLMGTAATVFYVAGLNRKYFQAAALVMMALVIGAIAVKPYRLQRVLQFADPGYRITARLDPTGTVQSYAQRATVTDASHQVRQSVIAVGAGGVFGRGLMNGTQKLFYLPEAHTDFIYAVIGEEFGLFGCTLLLCGFVVILWRGFRLYWSALDDFGRYIAVGATTAVVLQALINMSVVLNLAPTKGIPLPLISYGGSSLLSTMILLGLLLSVSERARQ
jgi:cell division protein FtsW